MTRIVHGSDGGEEMQEVIKKEVKGAVSRGVWSQKMRGCCGCLLITLILTLAPIILLAYGVAITGLVDVPFLSRFYHEPAPVRVVLPTNDSLMSSFQKQIESQLGAIVQAGQEKARVSILLHEKELTAGLRDFVDSFSKDDFKIIDGQVAVLDEYVEIFVLFSLNDKRSTLRLRVLPELADGRPNIQVKKVWLGEFPVWHRLVNFALQNALETQLKPFFERFGGSVQIEQFSFHEGVVELVGEVTDISDLFKED